MNLENIYRCFPKHLKILLEENILQNQMEMLEEIRIRNGLPIILKLGQAEKIIYYKTSTEDINFIFQKICDNSIYTYQNQIANGFITIQGGNRVGIVGMAAVNMKDGLVHLLKKESLTRGIKVRISEDNHVSLSFHIIVAYGVSISAVTDNLISNVKYRVEEFSGMPVDKINIYIEGVRVID